VKPGPLTGILAFAALVAATGASAGEAKGALYGDLRWSFDYAEDDSALPGPTYTTTDNNSVWGVKVSTIQGGVTAFGGYERFIDADEQSFVQHEVTRQAYLGVASFCGVFRVGKHATAYAESGRKYDPFFNTAASGIGGVGALGGAIAGNSHGSSPNFNADFVGAAIVPDHIAYESPALMGLRGNLAFFTDESGSGNQDHNYGAGLEFEREGLAVGVQFLDDNAGTWLPAGSEAMRAHAAYGTASFGVGASWEALSLPVTFDDQDYLMVSGWYGLWPATRVAASYGYEHHTNAPGESLRVGIFHDLIENLTLWAAFLRYDHQMQGATTVLQPDSDVITLGASYKFNLGFSSNTAN